jgi:hypothetical protein
MFIRKATLLVIFTFLISFLSLSAILKASTLQNISAEEALILLLYPEVEKQVDKYYKEYISDGPTVAPYSINIVDLYHTPNESGAYHYTIILEARPYVGAHIDVGLDRITFTLSLEGVESVLFEHLESETLPPWLQHHVIKPLP